MLAVGDWLKMASLIGSFGRRSFKVILSGDGSVGKKSIIERFVYDTHDYADALKNGGFSGL